LCNLQHKHAGVITLVFVIYNGQIRIPVSLTMLVHIIHDLRAANIEPAVYAPATGANSRASKRDPGINLFCGCPNDRRQLSHRNYQYFALRNSASTTVN
jgi:hypothetical protein